ncbi:toll/interleukin-1 receptor domain-containing protein [Sphingomonas flavalba]|uniref:toll/interleukin-1 receptor domain-containing protein n=1 Tax=Sphingomonas flavalba TaxID=2559804 RepID=UPI00109DB132|nr:toll/interleukin-1 receptor domain-containing protein [Sphingomonas flavalba]
MPRYRAFLSYSHRDKRVAAWLHRTLETYRVPSKLVGRPTAFGPVPARLTPIFRDRDELSAAADLGEAITSALAESLFLIVVCSPASARSPWVNEEIATFKRMHGEQRVLALITGGEPYASATPETAGQECFPPALRFKLIDGAVSDQPAEPIAADLRAEADGKRLAALKLVAGLTGLSLDDLVQRETQRRMRRLMIAVGAASTGMLLTSALALYANDRRIEANEQRLVAERETATARAASDYLIDTFTLSNPATENPRTISALTILDRGAARARRELAGQPVVQARLVSTLGQAYNNLGLFDEARGTIQRSMPAIQRAGADGASARLTLATTYLQLGRLDAALATVAAAKAALAHAPARDADQAARAAVIEGMIHTAGGDTRRGVAAFDQALALYRATPDTPPAKISTTLQNRGLLLSDDGQFAAAERSLRAALAINQRALGPRHLATGQSWFTLAQNAFMAGKLDDAGRYITNALAIERAVLDPDNRTIADALSMQGQIFHGQKRLAEARQSLDQAIAIYRRAFGRPHYLIGIAEVYLALVESERGRTEEALRILDDARHNYDVSYGKLHANHGDLLVNRATILNRAGRHAEARTDCAAGMRILGETLGPEANYTRSMAAVCTGMQGR